MKRSSVLDFVVLGAGGFLTGAFVTFGAGGGGFTGLGLLFLGVGDGALTPTCRLIAAGGASTSRKPITVAVAVSITITPLCRIMCCLFNSRRLPKSSPCCRRCRRPACGHRR